MEFIFHSKRGNFLPGSGVFRLLRKLAIGQLILTLLLPGCSDIPHDNPLDPQNPNSTRPQKVVVEAFVNLNDSVPVNPNIWALSALNSLASTYSPNLLIIEYHRNTRDYDDPYHLQKNESLYQKYIAQFNGMAGLPDIFFNGVMDRVQGASSTANSIARIDAALQNFLNHTSLFAIEINFQQDGDRVTPEVTLARLGTEDARNIVLKAVLMAEIDNDLQRRVVRDISTLAIASLDHGTFQTYTLDPLEIKEPQANHDLAIYVTDELEQEIFQAEVLHLP